MGTRSTPGHRGANRAHTVSRYDPWEHAEQMGVNVHFYPLRSVLGAWVPSERTILIRPGMAPFMERAILAHECAHAERDDPAGHHPGNEAKANLAAARRLINRDEIVDLLNIYSDYDHICRELGVTREMFIEYTKHEFGRGTAWAGKALLSALTAKSGAL